MLVLVETLGGLEVLLLVLSLWWFVSGGPLCPTKTWKFPLPLPLELGTLVLLLLLVVLAFDSLDPLQLLLLLLFSTLLLVFVNLFPGVADGPVCLTKNDVLILNRRHLLQQCLLLWTRLQELQPKKLCCFIALLFPRVPLDGEDQIPLLSLINACLQSDQDWENHNLNSNVAVVFNIKKNALSYLELVMGVKISRGCSCWWIIGFQLKGICQWTTVQMLARTEISLLSLAWVKLRQNQFHINMF